MKVLIVSVHPDDEVLGCGGTMMKLKAEGHDLYWLLMTDVTKAHGYNDEMVETTRRQIEELSQFVGFRDTFNCGYHAAHLHQVDFLDLVGDISKVMLSVKPDWVFSVNRSDIHTDHQVAARAVMSCSKSFRYPFIKRLSLYECISETEIAPPLPENVFLPFQATFF